MKMPKETYCLPIRVEIRSERPDVTMREIAEQIFDAVNGYAAKEIEPYGRMIDVQWSIYKKPDPERFGRQVASK